MKRPFQFIVAVLPALAGSFYAHAQSTYYDRQAQNRAYDNLHEQTVRAFAVPSSSSSSSYSGSSSSGSSSSSSSSSSGSSSGGNSLANMPIMAPQPYFNCCAAADQARRERLIEQHKQENAAREKAYESGKEHFMADIASKGHARTEADHFDLLLTGMRKGYDGKVIGDVIGYNIADYTKKYVADGPAFKRSGGKEEEADRWLVQLPDVKEPAVRAYLYKSIVAGYPTADNYGKMGVELFNSYQFSEAATAFKQAMDLDKGVNGFYKDGYASALAFAGDLTGAEAAYKKVLADDPNSFAEMNLAWVNIQQGKTSDALHYAAQASAKRPKDAGALLVQAGLQTDASKAKALADAATALRPDIGSGSIPSRIFAYAKLLHGVKDYYSSVLFLDMAVRAEPKNVDFLELRYGTNTVLKRNKQASKDAELLSEL